MKEMTQKEKKQRRFLIMMPVLALPFVIMLFWALGGGFDASAKNKQTPKEGLNANLPDPNFENAKTDDKMSFYQQARQDSLKLQEQMKNDPYYRSAAVDDTTPSGAQQVYPNGTAYGNLEVPTGDPNVDKINSRLKKLYEQINEPANDATGDITSMSETDRIQAALRTTAPNSDQDPEMAQLDGMLEKILDIQNPQRAKDKLREQSLKNRKQVYPVAATQKKDVVSLLQGNGIEAIAGKAHYQSTLPNDRIGNAFYEWSESADAQDSKTNAAAAVIQQTATVMSGATIKLRLLDEVYINGVAITRGTFVYGTCALNGDRLMITLNSIRYKNALFPVNLVAYDMDGIAGIYMPGAISRDVAKNSAQDAVQGVDYYAMDNSLTAQAASVGVSAVKSLLSKKAKLIKVTVKAGYKILLRDANAQE